MGSIKELTNTDLIKKAMNFEDINVIAHVCNCFCKQRKGFALLMSQYFNTEQFLLEGKEYEGDYDKLGRIDFKIAKTTDESSIWVVNMYAQYHWKDPSPYGIPLDYDALRLCLRKLNKEFSGYSIGLPGLIGCGLASGDPNVVMEIIQQEMSQSNVTICYPSSREAVFKDSSPAPSKSA